MKLTINNQTYDVDQKDKGRKLLWFLRDDLGLVGTRFGCGVGICGACTVLIDGEPTRSCITTLKSATNGKKVRTVEGLKNKNTLHPVQKAFISEQVPQCGWCMSGQMLAAVALLDKFPKPTKKQIKAALTKNYCRCGCYSRLSRAVEIASNYLQIST